MLMWMWMWMWERKRKRKRNKAEVSWNCWLSGRARSVAEAEKTRARLSACVCRPPSSSQSRCTDIDGGQATRLTSHSYSYPVSYLSLSLKGFSCLGFDSLVLEEKRMRDVSELSSPPRSPTTPLSFLFPSSSPGPFDESRNLYHSIGVDPPFSQYDYHMTCQCSNSKRL